MKPFLRELEDRGLDQVELKYAEWSLAGLRETLPRLGYGKAPSLAPHFEPRIYVHCYPEDANHVDWVVAMARIVYPDYFPEVIVQQGPSLNAPESRHSDPDVLALHRNLEELAAGRPPRYRVGHADSATRGAVGESNRG